MRYEAMASALVAGRHATLDGAIGTELHRRGASLDAWAALATAERPDLVLAVHEDYITAGADIVSANTFGCSEPRLASFGLGARMEELNRAAVALARAARDRAGRAALIAGCVTTVSHRGPEGAGLASPDEEWALAEQAAVLADAGADLIIVEMLSAVAHANVQLAATATAGLPVWAGFSCAAMEGAECGARLLAETEESFRDSLSRIDLSAVDVVLVMHTPLDVVAAALAEAGDVWRGPLGAYPHSGRWRRPGWEFDAGFTPEALASRAARWLSGGCGVVGGCCGSAPEHIRELRVVADAANASKEA